MSSFEQAPEAEAPIDEMEGENKPEGTVEGPEDEEKEEEEAETPEEGAS